MSGDRQGALLVTGASGQLGSRVLELLLESHTGPIIAVTRTPEKLAAFKDRGVLVRYADFDKPESLIEAFADTDRLLLISTDVVGQGDRRLQQQRNAVVAADKAGVTHIVYTSLVNPGPDSPVLLAPDHFGTEAALTASQLGWTVLRENIYADVMIFGLVQAVKIGKLFKAAGDGKAAYILREDVARASAAALSALFTGRRTLDITGPEALSQVDLAAIATTITGQQITYVPLELEVLLHNMVDAGIPRPVAEIYASFDTAIAQGKFSAVSSTVEDLTGHKAMNVREYLTTHPEILLQGVPQS